MKRLDNHGCNRYNIRVIKTHPGVAQLGSALDWGSRGRGFKSRHSDHFECS